MGACLSLDRREENHHGYHLPAILMFSPDQYSLKRRTSSRKSSWRSDGLLCDELRKIPGRLTSNGSSTKSSTTLFTQQGRKGVNQDAMIVWENFGSRVDTVFCGIFDGHGPYGHMVAGKVRDHLPLKLLFLWGLYNDDDDDDDDDHHHNNNNNNNSSIDDGNSNDQFCQRLSYHPDTSTVDSQEMMKNHPEIFLASKESFSKAFHAMDKELKCQNTFDCLSSGTTAVALLKQGQDLVIANLGDSRAILGTRDDDDSLVPVQLTVDHKPNLPPEKERIKQCKGRVFALPGEPDVHRVWLPHDDAPGLAMARSLGDFCLKDFGLVSIPDISYRRLTEKDQFIVLATDGVWDVLSNEEAVDIVATSPCPSSAARQLVQAAVRAWKSNHRPNSAKVDDCSAVCLHLNGFSSSRSLDSAEARPPGLRRSFTIR